MKKYIGIIMILCFYNAAFGQFGLMAGGSYTGRSLQSSNANTLIDNYNARHFNDLKTEMNYPDRMNGFGISGEMYYKMFFLGLGWTMNNDIDVHSVYNDKTRLHFNIIYHGFTTQTGVIFHLHDYIKIAAGVGFDIGNYRFYDKVFEPEVYAHFAYYDVLEAQKVKTKHLGGFARIMIGSLESIKSLFFIEGQYMNIVNGESLQSFNEKLNPNTFQNDSDLDMNGRFISLKIGFLVGVDY